MNSLSEIRGLLQNRALTAAGFPAVVKYEGMTLNPTVGTPWARMTFLPNTKRPFAINGRSRMDGGLLQIDLYFPSGKGTKVLEDARDAVLAVFEAGTNLANSDTSVWIDRAEPGPGVEDATTVSAFVRVFWRCHSDD